MTSRYPLDVAVPVHRGLSGDWQELVYQTDQRGRRRVVRMVYEICTFQALRDQLRCKEIWVVGANKWRSPAEDLPLDFEERRVEHYGALRKPLDPSEFIDELREEMRTELEALHAGLSECSWLDIAERRQGAIKLTPLPPVAEPRNLRKLKNQVQTRWGVVPLIDILKETVLRTGCLRTVTSVADCGGLPENVLSERLLLAIYSHGTNTGIRAVAAGAHGHGEDEIRYARRRYLSAEAARRIAIEIANATFAARRTTIWGQSSTAIASDSTHFGAFDQNIFTESHSRYGRRGVLIYWSVEKNSVVIHSQLLNCSASEVHAMIDGAIHHGTEMVVDANYVDTHGPTDLKNRHPAIPLPAGACTAGDWIDVGGGSPLRYFECRRRIIARCDPDDELTGRRAWPRLRQMVLRARCSWCRFEMRCAIPQVVPHCGGRYDVGTQSNNTQSANVLQRKSTRRKIIA